MPNTSIAEIQVEIEGISFNTNLEPGQNFYLLTDTPELISKLSTRSSDEERQGEHGSEDGLTYYDPREMEFKGEIYAGTQEERVDMEDALKQALALSPYQRIDGDDGYKLVLVTDEKGREMMIHAKVIVPPAFRLIEDGMPEARSFSFTLYAKDPYFFSTTLQDDSGEESFDSTNFTIGDEDEPTIGDGDEPQIYDLPTVSVMVENEGSYHSPPILIVHGPSMSPVIRNLTTGIFMDFSGGGGLSLAGGETLEIDVLAQTMTKISGSTETDARPYRSTDSGWVWLAPGENDLALTDSTPSLQQAELEVFWRDTFN